MFVAGSLRGDAGVWIEKNYQPSWMQLLYLLGEPGEIFVRSVKTVFENLDPESC